MTLLSKTRSLNRLLQQAAGKAVNFQEMADVLRDTIGADVFVVSRRGKVLGFALTDAANRDMLPHSEPDRLYFGEEHNHLLLHIRETASNSDAERLYHTAAAQIAEAVGRRIAAVVPIIGGGERIGTLVLSRGEKPFADDDFILAEYGSTIVAMEILRMRAEEKETEIRSKTAVLVAVNSLSFSELEAVEQIFEEMGGNEGLLVASKIADKAGITRSVVVNALRKLESAGVVETRSLGMKGTYIKILNEQLPQRFKK
ncbi:MULTISPECIES: GTP-sensing pleiotropic transcriptional regulator CodY [unclassified Paenibacillus]|uniref:GTP-sensing pleiotropic transcriptional regulator CodY n=1 Tax=unclassified Paenibacillus TaxID=185978 RepID=UPI001C1193F2|nr:MULTISPECIES: GTP-sensing pleiotropic transcriptional regulator CodY [unclassified Paenibacillus]MBU5441757.1 GTP-sensing pleiotropic transcriptional regulator CodY [Paenibacillus sp. MSJ-34]CAH0119802.1 GTP-sensing transcriptional pleiotropic repressor CodY [Paenibacillus sp. CECT 9249]